jgi:hypothetical protein
MRIATIERLARQVAEKLYGAPAVAAVADLREKLKLALLRSKALAGYVETSEDVPPLSDKGFQPNIVLKFTREYSPRFSSELEFSLQEGKLRAKVRMLGRSKVSEVEDEVHFFDVEGLAKTAVQRAVAQRAALLQELGFSMSPSTLKKLLKQQGNLAF